MKLFALLILIVLNIELVGQEPTIFPPEELKEDLAFMKESIERYNPALGVFHSEENFEQLYDSIYQVLNEPMSDLDFYPYLAILLAEIKEGHAYLGSGEDTSQYYIKGFLNNSFKFLPLNMKYIDGQAYVWANFTDKKRPNRGDIIISINGESIGSIIHQLKKFTSSDGDIVKAREKRIFSTFGGYYYWFIAKPDSFIIEYKPEASAPSKIINLPAKSRAEMIEFRNKKYGQPEQKEKSVSQIYSTEFNDQYAYLRLKSFNKGLMKEYKIKPKKIYKDFFKEIENKSVENLIIDLRDNPGGRVEYFRFLTPFITQVYDRGILYQTTSWKGKNSKYKFPKQKKHPYNGDIYVLTNAGSFSNGSVVAWYAQEYCDAVVIGEETGSRAEGFAAGSRQRLKLPNTRISLNIPRYLFIYTTNRTIRNRGVIPDIKVAYSFRDLEEESDPVMKKALELIMSK